MKSKRNHPFPGAVDNQQFSASSSCIVLSSIHNFYMIHAAFPACSSIFFKHGYSIYCLMNLNYLTLTIAGMVSLKIDGLTYKVVCFYLLVIGNHLDNYLIKSVGHSGHPQATA